MSSSEVWYRRIFEATQDGILILDADTGRITDVNPYLVRLLGRSKAELLGKELWEIGLFRDAERSKAALRELERDGYIRYEDLPLETGDGRHIAVEFVSSSYKVGGLQVIQCNIRDITERKQVEFEKALLVTVEAERQRIGKDLHEGLCQQLAGVSLLIKALARKLSAVMPAGEAEAAKIVELISQSIDQTRDMARGLSPVQIEMEGLAPALQIFAAATERLHQISCTFIHDETAGSKHRYTPLLATHIYRIVQEAVNSAIHRGKVKKVEITLVGSHDRKILTIKDDGAGLPSDAEEKQDPGLRAMRHRGSMIGVQFKVSRGPGGGMVVVCSFPHQSEPSS